MPIPTAVSSDVLLRQLLDRQVEDFDEWIDVEDLLKTLPNLDLHQSDEARVVPRSVQRDIEFLQRHRLLAFRPENPHVRLTPLGVYTALLFEPLPDATSQSA
jgi:hypothetical protein